MKKLLIALIVCFAMQAVNAQKYYTRSGKISFFSDAPLEKIEANNSKATAVMDIASGAMEWAVLIKGFEFEKALMQEHFNENYMESSKFPKSVFKGKVDNWNPIDISINGKYNVILKGQLTIHGISNDIEVPVILTVNNGSLSGNAAFSVAVADYQIKIPGVVKDKIAKTVDVIVDAQFQPLETK